MTRTQYGTDCEYLLRQARIPRRASPPRRCPPAQPDSFGLSLFRNGTLTTDDYAMYDTIGAPSL